MQLFAQCGSVKTTCKYNLVAKSRHQPHKFKVADRLALPEDKAQNSCT